MKKLLYIWIFLLIPLYSNPTYGWTKIIPSNKINLLKIENKQVIKKIDNMEKTQNILIQKLNNLQKKLDRLTFIITALLSAIFTLLGILIMFTYWNKKRN